VSPRRGDGIGLELLDDRLYGVRLAADAPGRLVAAAEAVCEIDYDVSVAAAVVRVANELAADVATPVRVAVFAPGDALQSIDVTAVNDAAQRAHLAASTDATGYATFQYRARRWMSFTTTSMAVVQRARRSMLAAGFNDVTWEPAPVAAARVMTDAHLLGRNSRSARWAAVVLDGVPVAAATVDRWPPETDTVELLSARSDLHLDLDGLGASFEPDTVRALLTDHCSTASSVPCSATILGDAYPPFDPSHPLAVGRAGVAVGAAVAAAGLLAHQQRWVGTALTHGTDDHRPWAVERLPDSAPQLVAADSSVNSLDAPRAKRRRRFSRSG
jgi:hypothetical protein